MSHRQAQQAIEEELVSSLLSRNLAAMWKAGKWRTVRHTIAQLENQETAAYVASGIAILLYENLGAADAVSFLEYMNPAPVRNL